MSVAAELSPWLTQGLGTSALPSPELARGSQGKAVEPKGEELGSEVRQVDLKLSSSICQLCDLSKALTYLD